MSNRVNRGNPSLGVSSLSQSGSSGGGGGGLRHGRGGTGSYAGASRSGGSEWSSSPSQNRGAANNNALKQGNGAANPSSPNPYAPSFVSSSSSPWTTPSGGGGGGGGGGGRYQKQRSGSHSGTAARTLFPAGEDKFASGKNPANWEEHVSGDIGSDGGSEEPNLLKNHPEHWESYDAGQLSQPSASPPAPQPTVASVTATASTLAPPPADTTPSGHTPFDSPSLGSFGAGSEPVIDAPLLDERGTDLSLSLIKKPDGTPNEISIHMLSLLYDPPVQGCELKPYVSVVDSFGRVNFFNSDENSSGLDFRWFRGQKRICSNVAGGCSKAATMQCVSCAKMSASVIPQHLTYFCSDRCLKDNWHQHKQMHMQQHNISKTRERMQEWGFDEDSDFLHPDSLLRLHCKYPSLLQNTWQETGAEHAYVPTSEDVGRALRLECAPILKAPKKDVPPVADKDAITSTSHMTTDLNLGTVVRIDTGAVLPTPQPPPPRTNLYTDPSTPINSANTFRTVCYNVLAQIYTTRQVYPYTSIWALSWEYRKNLLLREILSHNADVIALQEVQANHFETFFQPQLSKHGYDGIFKRKTRDAGSDSAGNQMIDGCATFYKRERFALMEQYGIEFNTAARQHTTNRTQLRRLLRGNIALVLVLEELTPPPTSANSSAARRNRKRRLCITNTHIFWDPEYPEVKLWQTWVLCQELEKLVLPRNLPLVLCGDFNSTLDSSVYELLSTERVEQGEDVFGATGDPTGLLPAPHQVAHRLPLLSAYATIGEPKYTNFTGSFVGVLDYVFFTRTHLRCVACMEVDDEAILRQHTALPSPQYASDHISLVATLEFLDA